MPAPHLHLELDVPGTLQELARTASDWLTEGRARLLPDHEAGLAAHPSTRGPQREHPDAPWGPPHGVYAGVLLRQSPTRRSRHPRYSPAAWSRILATFEEAPPHQLILQLHHLDAAGHPVDGDAALCAEIECQWLRPEDTGPYDPPPDNWLRCAARTPVDRPGWPDSRALSATWHDALAAWGPRTDARYGHVTDDADTTHGTALERVTNRFPEETVPYVEETLRGYSWATLCAPSVAARLGGAAALRASGAFHEVRQLADEAVLLQTTERLDAYTAPACSRALRALAPALPPGRTEQEYLSPWMRLAPDDDPRDHT